MSKKEREKKNNNNNEKEVIPGVGFEPTRDNTSIGTYVQRLNHNFTLVTQILQRIHGNRLGCSGFPA